MIKKPVNPNAEYIAEFWSDTITPEMQEELQKKIVKNGWGDYGKYGNLIVSDICTEFNINLQGIAQHFLNILGNAICDNCPPPLSTEFVIEVLQEIDMVLPVFNSEFTIDIDILERLHEVLQVWLMDELDPYMKLTWFRYNKQLFWGTILE